MTEQDLSSTTRAFRKRQRFEYSVSFVKSNEGSGLVSRLYGTGKSKYGVSNEVAPAVNLESLTESRATELLRNRYWDRFPYSDILAPEVAAKAFDTHVFIDADTSHTLLRRTLIEIGYDVEQTGSLNVELVNFINTVLKDSRITELLEGYVGKITGEVSSTVTGLKSGAAIRRAQKLPTVNNE